MCFLILFVYVYMGFCTFLHIFLGWEAKLVLFQHQVELMRQHEILENSSCGPNLMTEPESKISITTLFATVESQGRFKKQKNKNQKQKKQ